MDILFSLIFGLIFGALSAYLAAKRGRRATLWFFIGLFAGLFGLLLVLILPASKEGPSQDALSLWILRKGKKELLPRVSPYQNHQWYYVDEERKAIGPVSFLDLKDLYAKETLSDESLLWHEGAAEWQPLSNFGGLESDLTS